MKNKILCIYLFNILMGFSVDLSLGEVYNLDQDISISRTNGSDINFHASFKTNGLKSPQYYSLRLGSEIRQIHTEFEFIHHKLYVEDLPPEIDKFEVSDGYNLLLINIVNNIRDNLLYRFGLGTVVTHPDIVIEGQTNYVEGGGLIPKFWTEGYHWGGICSQASLGYRKKITSQIQLNLETKIIYASAKIPVVDGSFILPNLSLHFLAGFSFGT